MKRAAAVGSQTAGVCIFNPTIVRFKQNMILTVFVHDVNFQSYYSSIQTYPRDLEILEEWFFQSYYSSIQTVRRRTRRRVCLNFQSYYSSIQTSSLAVEG